MGYGILIVCILDILDILDMFRGIALLPVYRAALQPLHISVHNIFGRIRSHTTARCSSYIVHTNYALSKNLIPEPKRFKSPHQVMTCYDAIRSKTGSTSLSRGTTKSIVLG